MARLILFIIVTLVTYFYPLYFAYTDWLFILPKMAGLWFVAFCFGIAFIIEFPRQMKTIVIKTVIVLALLIPFWVFNDDLCAKSEDFFFYFHRSEFNAIVEKITKDNLFSNEPDAELRIYHLDGYEYIIARGQNYIAIGTKSMLDNTDGFLFMPSGEFPSNFFEGNLTYTEKIEDNWYKFSTR